MFSGLPQVGGAAQIIVVRITLNACLIIAWQSEANWEFGKPKQGSSFTKQRNLIENKSYLQKECNLHSVSGEDRLSTSCARAIF
jgi:phosphoribosylformylglycinamidine (FGAM) synthase-like enzyme